MLRTSGSVIAQRAEWPQWSENKGSGRLASSEEERETVINRVARSDQC